MSTCQHCGKEHPPPTLGEIAEVVLDVVRETAGTPKEGAVVLALALGRLIAVCGLDLESFLKVTREAYELSDGKVGVKRERLFPIRGSSWRC